MSSSGTAVGPPPPPPPPRKRGREMSGFVVPEAVPADHAVERTAAPRHRRIRRQAQRFRPGRVADREHGAQVAVFRDAEEVAGALLVVLRIDRADARADPMGPRPQHEVLDEPALVHTGPGIVAVHDERYCERGTRDMTGKGPTLRERPQRVAVAP